RPGAARAAPAAPPYLGRDSRLLQREPEVIHRLTGTLGDTALANAHAHDPAVARGALRPAPFGLRCVLLECRPVSQSHCAPPGARRASKLPGFRAGDQA